MGAQSLLTQALGCVKNRFLLTNILAKRIMQLRKGSKPLIETDEEDMETIALREIIEGKLEWEMLDGALPPEEVQAPIDEADDS